MTTQKNNKQAIIIRGAGEMATGVMHRLFQSGYKIIGLELKQPLSVRRMVCFSEAIYENSWTVEGVTAVRADNVSDVEKILSESKIPVLIDADGSQLNINKFSIVIDARLLKQNVTYHLCEKQTVIGLGPGFIVGQNCHAVIETNRGDNLGTVLYSGSAEADTGLPAEVNGVGIKRVIRADREGQFASCVAIGDAIGAGEAVGRIDNRVVTAQINGIVRGLIRDKSMVLTNQKIGDIDPRKNKELCYQISDKAQAIAKGALEAIQAITNS